MSVGEFDEITINRKMQEYRDFFNSLHLDRFLEIFEDDDTDVDMWTIGIYEDGVEPISFEISYDKYLNEWSYSYTGSGPCCRISHPLASFEELQQKIKDYIGE